jgi:Type IX secretion system protein PorV
MEEDMLLGVNYTPWMRGLTNEVFLGSVSFARRINERSTWGLGMRYFSMGTIELSDAFGNPMGTENPNEFALDGSYSLKLSENFAMAVSGRYVRSDYAVQVENSDLQTVNTFVVDVGGYYQSDVMEVAGIKGIWRGGMALSNLGSKVEVVAGAEKSQMPTNLKLGTGYEFLLDDVNSLTANLEMSSLLLSNNDLGKFIYALGAEYKYKNVFALRTGYFHEGEDFGNRQFATLGGGIAFRNSKLDVSYLINTSNVTSPLENTLRFSLSFFFGNGSTQEIIEDEVALR